MKSCLEISCKIGSPVHTSLRGSLHTSLYPPPSGICVMLKPFSLIQRNLLSKSFQIEKFCSALAIAPTIVANEHPIVSYAEHSFPLPISDTNTKNVIDKINDRKFAVIQFSGHQYKVTEGDSIIVDKFDVKDIGEELEFENVLLVGSKTSTFVGRPIIPGARVTAVVEEKLKDAKVIIFKKRRRKNSQRKRGFRRDICVLRIGSIEYNHPSPN